MNIEADHVRNARLSRPLREGRKVCRSGRAFHLTQCEEPSFSVRPKIRRSLPTPAVRGRSARPTDYLPASRAITCGHQSDRGATMVEFVISAGIIFMFLVGALETMRYSLQVLGAQYAAAETLRRKVIIRTMPSTTNPFNESEVRDYFVNFAASLGALSQTSNVQVRLCTAIQSSTNGGRCPAARTVGTPRDLMQLEVTFDFRSLAGGLTFPVRVAAVGKNEPYRLDPKP